MLYKPKLNNVSIRVDIAAELLPNAPMVIPDSVVTLPVASLIDNRRAAVMKAQLLFEMYQNHLARLSCHLQSAFEKTRVKGGTP